MPVLEDVLLRAPLVGRGIVVFFEDLEPPIPDAFVCGGIVDFLHVHSAWTLVGFVNATSYAAIGPEMVLERHGRPCRGWTNSRYTVLAIHTCRFRQPSHLEDSALHSLISRCTFSGQECTVRDRVIAARAKRTACHVVTSNTLDGRSSVFLAIAHAHARSISHVGPIDIEVGEGSVSAGNLSSCSHQRNTFYIEEMHFGLG